MNTMIVALFIVLAVATAHARVSGGATITAPLAAPLGTSILSAPLAAPPLIARSVIDGPLAAGIVPALPLAVARSVIATPTTSVISSPALSPLAVRTVL